MALSVVIDPAEVAERADGTIAFRRIRSGHRGSKEFEKLPYFLYQQAAIQKYGNGAVVEAIHLTDNEVEEVPAAPTALRITKTEKFLREINDGCFNPKLDPFSCPRCPHFFICAATPNGSLALL